MEESGSVGVVEKEVQMERNNVVLYSYDWHDQTRRDDLLMEECELTMVVHTDRVV